MSNLATQPYIEVTQSDEGAAMMARHMSARQALLASGMDLEREIVEWYDPIKRVRHWRQYLPPNAARLCELATGIKQIQPGEPV